MRHPLILLAILVNAAFARAQTAAPAPSVEAAREHFYAGQRALDAGDAPAAIRELSAAQALVYAPGIELPLGVAYDRAGQPCIAAAHLGAFVRALPTAPEHDAVAARIAELAPGCAAAPAPLPCPNLVVAADAPVRKKHSRAWKAGVALGVIGGVLTVALVGSLVVRGKGGDTASSPHHDFGLVE